MTDPHCEINNMSQSKKWFGIRLINTGEKVCQCDDVIKTTLSASASCHVGFEIMLMRIGKRENSGARGLQKKMPQSNYFSRGWSIIFSSLIFKVFHSTFTSKFNSMYFNFKRHGNITDFNFNKNSFIIQEI